MPVSISFYVPIYKYLYLFFCFKKTSSTIFTQILPKHGQCVYVKIHKDGQATVCSADGQVRARTANVHKRWREDVAVFSHIALQLAKI